MNSEACYWIVNGDKSLFKDSSEIMIQVNLINSAKMYLFRGNDRHNASLVIEGNSSASIGAPYKIPIKDGAIIVV